MRLLRVARLRLRSLLRGYSTDREMQRELALHLEQLTKEFRAEGMSEHDARLAARRAFGGVDVIAEEIRDARRVSLVEDLVKDVGYAVRVLRKSPAFTLTAVLSLALGIGANTAIFSVVNAFLLRPLPFPQPDRLVALFERNVMGDEARMSVAPGNFLDWQQQSTSFESVSAYTINAGSVSAIGSDAEPERLMVCICSGNIFATLGVTPIIGRPFLASEDRFNGDRVVVISSDLWQRQFGGAADVIGRGVRLNGTDYQIVGVMPRDFMFPNRNVAVWRPLLLTMSPVQQERHGVHYLQVVGRVRNGFTREQAEAEISGISARYKNAHPTEATGSAASAVPLHAQLVEGVRRSLVILLGAVTCVLLIACVNIANLGLTRALARTREIGVRAALGASRGRIIRQLVTESVLLALAGGATGFVLARSLANVLVANAPGAEVILPAGNLRLDPAIFVFAFAIALTSGIIIGLLPAIRATRDDVVTDLKEMTRSATSSRTHGRLRALFVSAEMALSLMLLIAAGLLLRSFVQLYDVRSGVRVDHTLLLSTTLTGASYREAPQRSAAFRSLADRLGALPGVTSAGLTNCAPLTGSCNVLFFYIEGRLYAPGKFDAALERGVDPDYFRSAGVPLVRGRSFTDRDGVGFDPKQPRVGSIVISEMMARTFFANEDPIGKRVFFDFEVQRERTEGFPAPRYEIVGIVGDVLPTLDGTITPTMYRPILDIAPNSVTAILQTSAEPSSVAGAARAAVRDFDRNLMVFGVQSLEESIGRSTATRRFTLWLFAAFAGLAVMLAAIGLYGVVSYAVSQRRTEIGIRVALGATNTDVRRMVMMQGIKPAFAGAVAGLVAAALVARVLKAMLFGVTPMDPLSFALVPVFLLVVAAAACYLPAWRAARQDPTTALRSE
jgi:putative ABC transport system permease protein